MKTIRVRIAVAVDLEGKWTAYPWPRDPKAHDAFHARSRLANSHRIMEVHFIEVDVPAPEATTIQGMVG